VCVCVCVYTYIIYILYNIYIIIYIYIYISIYVYTHTHTHAHTSLLWVQLSKLMGEKSMMKRACGTWAYWAPEILRRQPYDTSVDLWSVEA
jgi:serine/threonine protein kinase